MRVIFKRLEMENFKSQEKLTVDFGNITKVSGRNGAGKSSISEAITWALFGVDMTGSKFDPTPLTAEKDTLTSAKLLLEMEAEGQDPAELLLGRELLKGKAKYFVNEIPEKATKFDEVVSNLFEKNLFLSIFNPVYFPMLHWKNQREQLLKYIEEPFDKEILEKLDQVSRQNLEEKLKKNTVDELVKIYSPKLKETKVKVERAGERYLTLKEQYERALETFEEFDEDRTNFHIEECEKKLAIIRKGNKEGNDIERRKSEIEYELKNSKTKMNKLKAEIVELSERPIKENCHTCGQRLTDEALEAVEANKKETINKLMQNGKAMAAEYKKFFAELENLPTRVNEADTQELQEHLYKMRSRLDEKKRLEELRVSVESAELAKEQIRQDMLEAQAVIDAVKEYETKKAEMMVLKVDALFDRLTVKLFEEQKNGERKPTFEIEYQGKPYAKLSTAERIKAGLELVEALIGQAKITLPVFVDNAESIITFKKPSAQLITATVKNSGLTIKQEGRDDNNL